MKLRTLVGVWAIAAVGVTSCTGGLIYFGGKAAYDAVEDNTEWGIKKQALEEAFYNSAYGDYSDESLVNYLSTHGWQEAQAQRFPECAEKYDGAKDLEDTQKIKLVKGCMERGL